jgi:hypothetical protein
MENKGGVTMNKWKLTSAILSILLSISLFVNIQQPANFEKTQLKSYSLKHAQLNQTLQDTIEKYEKDGNQKELGEQLLLMSGLILNITPAGDTVATITFDFDYDIRRVLYEVHRKARGDQLVKQDIERLKSTQKLFATFDALTLKDLENKTVGDYEDDFNQFMEHYETKKHDLFK